MMLRIIGYRMELASIGMGLKFKSFFILTTMSCIRMTPKNKSLQGLVLKACNSLNFYGWWRAWQDSNLRPTD
jgi:hypothetical protein